LLEFLLQKFLEVYSVGFLDNQQRTLSRKSEDGVTDSDGEQFEVSTVVEVKREASPPRKKRTYRRRKPCGRKRSSAVKNGSESVDKLIGQLVSAYCGNDGHPSNCQDCQSRIDAIRALLQSSEKCTGEEHPAASVSSVDSQQESSAAKSAGVGLFSCSKCSDRFDTFEELKKHNKLHFPGKKPCSVCNRQISVRCMAVVRFCYLCTLFNFFSRIERMRCRLFAVDGVGQSVLGLPTGIL